MFHLLFYWSGTGGFCCLLFGGWLFFFSYIAGQARDMVGQAGILSRIEIKFPWKQEPKKEHKQNTNKQHPHTRPLSPSKVLFYHVVFLHVVQWLDVSHIYICTKFLRRVSYVWLRTSALELISALSSLPTFAQFSMNASTSDCATAFFSRSHFGSSFTCSSVAQTLAGAAYLPTIVFASSEGDPWGHPYLLRGFGFGP